MFVQSAETKPMHTLLSHNTDLNHTLFLIFRIEVFSTNYRRTQLSAQGFLDGFLGGMGGVPVVVRPRAEDFLNQWESRGHEMYEVCLCLFLGVERTSI